MPPGKIWVLFVLMGKIEAVLAPAGKGPHYLHPLSAECAFAHRAKELLVCIPCKMHKSKVETDTGEYQRVRLLRVPMVIS